MKGPVQSEEALFEAALQYASAEARSAYLDAACAGQPELRRAMDKLLAAHESTGAILDTPVARSDGPPVDGSASEPAEAATRNPTVKIALRAEEAIGSMIGRYKILEKVGEGGFGTVYVAEQREPVKRRVALKIIKLGMDTRQVVARFEAERQALSMMDHPNIAKVLDAGATDTGRPFFIMELVRGIKLTDYCDQNKLSATKRIELFIQICHAIQHAHQKGIIHRDIKPSNILVTLHDGVAVPKVIDFGIAKATQGELTDKTVYTQYQQFIGTPAYMSPEQAEMSGLDVDTRSDIYSLGVLLYELLTGRTPFDQKDLLEAGLDGMRRMIREKDPVAPSTRVSSLQGEDRTTTALRRGLDAPKLAHLLRGDLDWIVLKCLEKDRTLRYETANGLAMDLKRYLKNEPVVARPPSKFYRFQKTVRRNKLAFASAAVIALALLIGAVVTSWQAVRAGQAESVARRERDAATRARQQAEAIARFLTEDLLFQATPDENAREKKVTMEEVLARSARKLDEDPQITAQPEIEATLRLAVGSTYAKLALLPEAERHLRSAVNLRRDRLGPEHPDTLVAQQELADFLGRGARKFDEAESLGLKTWQARLKLFGETNRETLNSLCNYIEVLADQKKLTEAERLARQRLSITERVFGPDDRNTVDAQDNLAYVLAHAGKYAEAEKFAARSLAHYQRLGLADRLDAIYSANNLAMFRLMQGRAAEAEPLLAEARPRASRIFGPEHVLTLHVSHCLVRVLAAEGKLDEAESLARETLEARRRATPGHEGTGRTLMYLGRILVGKGKLDVAEPYLREAHTLFRERYPKKPELAAEAANWLGAIHCARREYSAAEALLLANPEALLVSSAAITAAERSAAIGHIVSYYQATGKPEQAGAWQKRLDEAGKSPNGK
jgi:serine/threonine protein kinase